MGGTFHPFHAGHEAMLRAAMDGATHVFVGVTDGELGVRKDREVPPWETRAETVRAFVAQTGWTGTLETHALTHPSGPAATGDYDAIVASPETAAGADRINVARAKAGLPALAVRLVHHVRGPDLRILSASRVAAGDVDRDGQRLTPLRVAVGSANPVKVAAVAQEFESSLGIAVDARGFHVDSSVPEQPKGDETQSGANARANAALEKWPDAEYGVGIEAGLQSIGDAWFDVQACVISDRHGRQTIGWGPGFQYPEWVTQRALAGEMISEILGPVANDPRIGGTTGAIGFLTDGRMDRTALTRHAVLMALTPRFHPDLYAQD